MAQPLLTTTLISICLCLSYPSLALDNEPLPPQAAVKAEPAKKAKAAKTEPKAPTWVQLTPQQQAVLADLATQWDQQPNRLRLSLVQVANKFPQMKPDEQERVRKRIARWASLTPEQRQAARERYKQIKQQPPEKQKEVKKKYQKYKAEKKSQTPPVTTSEDESSSAAPAQFAPHEPDED